MIGQRRTAHCTTISSMLVSGIECSRISEQCARVTRLPIRPILQPDSFRILYRDTFPSPPALDWITLQPGNTRGLETVTGLLAHDNDRYLRLADCWSMRWHAVFRPRYIFPF